MRAVACNGLRNSAAARNVNEWYLEWRIVVVCIWEHSAEQKYLNEESEIVGL
jgi:hypothetical protein